MAHRATCVSTPAAAPLGRAMSTLSTLQQALEELAEGRGADATGTALNEGQYLRLCGLTGSIHAHLNAIKAALDGDRGALAEAEALNAGPRRRDAHEWTSTRIDQVNGQTVVTHEYGPRRQPLVC